ncbi:hypothetical protein AURDEDRAFT_169013 [Auricularia subglabra TFB-10046 SS5]|nr:hypothetical protein AURDEDRAFT_169013 [Auricularia subglabra TFB-10046 SS5]
MPPLPTARQQVAPSPLCLPGDPGTAPFALPPARVRTSTNASMASQRMLGNASSPASVSQARSPAIPEAPDAIPSSFPANGGSASSTTQHAGNGGDSQAYRAAGLTTPAGHRVPSQSVAPQTTQTGTGTGAKRKAGGTIAENSSKRARPGRASASANGLDPQWRAPHPEDASFADAFEELGSGARRASQNMLHLTPPTGAPAVGSSSSWNHTQFASMPRMQERGRPQRGPTPAQLLHAAKERLAGDEWSTALPLLIPGRFDPDASPSGEQNAMRGASRGYGGATARESGTTDPGHAQAELQLEQHLVRQAELEMLQALEEHAGPTEPAERQRVICTYVDLAVYASGLGFPNPKPEPEPLQSPASGWAGLGLFWAGLGPA